MADQEYDELAARLTDPNISLPAPGEVQAGAVAEADGRDFSLGECRSVIPSAGLLRRRVAGSVRLTMPRSSSWRTLLAARTASWSARPFTAC